MSKISPENGHSGGLSVGEPGLTRDGNSRDFDAGAMPPGELVSVEMDTSPLSPDLTLKARSLPNRPFDSRPTPTSFLDLQRLRPVWESWETSRPVSYSCCLLLFSFSSISCAWVEKKSPKSPGEPPRLDSAGKCRESRGSRWERWQGQKQGAKVFFIPLARTRWGTNTPHDRGAGGKKIP